MNELEKDNQRRWKIFLRQKFNKEITLTDYINIDFCQESFKTTKYIIIKTYENIFGVEMNKYKYGLVISAISRMKKKQIDDLSRLYLETDFEDDTNEKLFQMSMEEILDRYTSNLRTLWKDIKFLEGDEAKW